jgi:hypothetical protein
MDTYQFSNDGATKSDITPGPRAGDHAAMRTRLAASCCIGALSGALWGALWGHKAGGALALGVSPLAVMAIAILEGALVVGALSTLASLLYGLGLQLCGGRSADARDIPAPVMLADTPSVVEKSGLAEGNTSRPGRYVIERAFVDK